MSSEAISQELRGAPVAKAITEELAVQVEELRTQGVTPKLVIVRIGQKSDDLTMHRCMVVCLCVHSLLELMSMKRFNI